MEGVMKGGNLKKKLLLKTAGATVAIILLGTVSLFFVDLCWKKYSVCF